MARRVRGRDALVHGHTATTRNGKPHVSRLYTSNATTTYYDDYKYDNDYNYYDDYKYYDSTYY